MRENLPDEVDRASENEAILAEEGVARARMAAQPNPPKDWDGETCYECGNEMPKERLAMRWHQCVPCKSLIEKRSKGY